MARTRVPVKGSIGKAILAGVSTTTVNQTTVVQKGGGGNSGVGPVSATIWPLVAQIPVPVLDIAALSGSGLLAFDGTNVVERVLAVDPKLTITNPAGAAGNPTIGFATETANLVLAGPASGSAAGPTFRSLTTADIPTLPTQGLSIALADLSTNPIYGISGSPITKAGTLDITLLSQSALKVFAGPLTGSAAPTFRSLTTSDIPTLPASQISGLATVATTGLITDTTGLLPATRISGLSTVAISGLIADTTGLLSLSRLATIPDMTVLGNVSGGAASPSALTTTQLATLVSAGVTFANPTAKVGPTTVNGSATSAMRSDAAPAIDLTAAYPWTGTHTFNGSLNFAQTVTGMTLGVDSGVPELAWHNASAGTDAKTWSIYADSSGTMHLRTVNDAFSAAADAIVLTRSGNTVGTITIHGTVLFPDGAYVGDAVPGISVGLAGTGGAVRFIAPSGATDEKLWDITNGTTASGVGTGQIQLRAVNDAFTAANPFILANRTGIAITGMFGYGPVGGTIRDMQPDASSFNGTFTGFSGGAGILCVWAKNGQVIVLNFFAAPSTGTSNNNVFGMTGLPAAITPARPQYVAIPVSAMVDNNLSTTSQFFSCQVETAGSITFYLNGGATSWTPTGLKGITKPFSITYEVV